MNDPDGPRVPALFDLTGTVALVTGSSRGIGRALAEGLAGAGATVVLNGRDEDRLDQTRAELAGRWGTGRVHAYGFDVTDERGVERAVAAVETEVGPVGVLVNNAGVQHRVPLVDLDAADWRRVIETDLTSAFLVGRAVARSMISRARGKIVNVASVQSDLARPGIGPYTAAKGGIRTLTRVMAAEWAGSGIQVNALAPGYLATEMTQALVDDPDFTAWVVGRTPAARWGTTADLVGPAVWLASPASDFVNGQTIFVDGGMTVVV